MELLAIALGVAMFAQLFAWSRKGDCDCARKHDASDWERRDRQDGATDGPDT